MKSVRSNPVARRGAWSESGRGQPHSKTLRDAPRPPKLRKVLECGCPLPLFRFTRSSVQWLAVLLCALIAGTSGCGGRKAKAQQKEFFTSGSKEADQRASQRMAKEEQLTGEGEGVGEKGVKKAKAKGKGKSDGKGGVGSGGETNKGAEATGKLALYERLGGEAGITNIVNDFVQRALEDPRVNWERKGVKQGGFSIHAGKSVAWYASAENVEKMKIHIVQFIALATGGPAHYQGKEMKAAHENMHIANPEFDAALGDLKASLDKLKVPNKEQKELLAIIESTRPLIVEQR